MWCDKERQKSDQKNAITSMKTACSWVSYDKISLEFRFWEKPTLENNISTCINYSSGHESKQSVKWIVQL